MNVKKIIETALGFDKSYIIVEGSDRKIEKVNLRRDKKRFNQGSLENQYYMFNNGNRIYVNEIKAAE